MSVSERRRCFRFPAAFAALVSFPLLPTATPAQDLHPCVTGISQTTPERIQEQGVVPGVVQIRLAEGVVRAGPVSAKATGVAELDDWLRERGVREVRWRPPAAHPTRGREVGLERELLLRLGPDADVRSLAGALEQLDSVERAAPNRLLSLARTPDDPTYPDQWGHDNRGQAVSASGTPVGLLGFDTDADLAWDGPQGFGVSGVVIGVIDSGVDLDHPDLLLAPGFDFIENDDQAQPDTSGANLGSHGTKVAGMAAGLAGNGIGVAGSCGGCSIMPLRVTILGGAVVETCAADAIVWAVDHGARVVNMSFGIAESAFFDAAIEYARLHDVVLVAASGNGNLDAVWYPARHPLVIAVGAASPCGERKRSASDPLGTSCDGFDAWGSSYGAGLDFLAPGVANPTTTWNQGYDPSFWGTSSAAPYLAGVVGLLLSHRPTLTPAQVKQALAATANDIVELPGDEGYDIRTGWGMVDAQAALAEPPLPECADGVDNDGDGTIDHPLDPGCQNATSASREFTQCSDGIDNDGDGWVDAPQDPGCVETWSPIEAPACDDGVDNDGDGWTDHPEDPECTSPADFGEGPGSSGCGLGVELGLVVALLHALARRARRPARIEARMP